MDYYKRLADIVGQVELTPGASSYESTPEKEYDPMLFLGDKLHGYVRDTLLAIVLNFLKTRYQNPEEWTTVFLAGSGVSHRWRAEREPADLDCLLTLNYNLFRQSNARFSGFSNQEIANQINSEIKTELHPKLLNYLGKYDITVFAVKEDNLKNIKPYAAYSVTDNEWLVEPSMDELVQNPDWEHVVDSDLLNTRTLMERYSNHLYSLLSANNDVARRNAEVHLVHTLEQAEAMYNTIHESRSQAFSSAGEGYLDFNNYRWQRGKKTGAIGTLKTLANLSKKRKNLVNEETYGVELPSTDTLIRRAALHNRRTDNG